MTCIFFRNIEKCHYTYVTKFKPTQEEICQEHFQKKCRITFSQTPVNETVRKCYTPVEKVCNGQGPEECRIVHQSRMWRNSPASLWEILPAKTCLWRSVEQLCS